MLVVCLLFLSFSQMSLKCFSVQGSKNCAADHSYVPSFLRSEKEDHLKTGWI